MSGEYNSNVRYGAIQFMEQVLNSHTAVASFRKLDEIQFQVSRTQGRSDLNVVFVDEYVLGEAAAYAIMEDYDNVEVIVNNGTWNHIVIDWRDFAERTGVVIFKVTDFMGAINLENIKEYVTADEREESRRERRRPSG